VSRLRRRGIELACLALGLGILAATFWGIGVARVVQDLRLLGWGLAVILLVESSNVVVNTWAWALAFPRGERTVSMPRLLAARLAGDGVNYLTPSATVGGELLRVRLLRHHVTSSVRWASVGVAKVGQSVAQAVFILLGLALVLPRISDTSAWIGGIGGVVTAALLAAAFVWLIGRGFWATARGALHRLRLGRLVRPGWVAAGRDLDAALVRLGPGRAAASLGCFVAGWAVGAAEIYLILSWVGGGVDWSTAVALETGSVFIDGVLFFVPAKIGTQEGGKVALFAALGLDPVRGLTVGVVRRIRELSYAGLGLLVLGWLSLRAGREASRRPLPSRLAGSAGGRV
jgi:glycosyltransferase 2 family protein